MTDVDTDLLHDHISELERRKERLKYAAPTVPIYDLTAAGTAGLRIQNDSLNTSDTGAWVDFGSPLSEVYVRMQAIFHLGTEPVTGGFLHFTPGDGGVDFEPESYAYILLPQPGPTGSLTDGWGAGGVFNGLVGGFDTGQYYGGAYSDDISYQIDFHAVRSGAPTSLGAPQLAWPWDTELKINGISVGTGVIYTINRDPAYNTTDTLSSFYMSLWGNTVTPTMTVQSLKIGTTDFGTTDICDINFVGGSLSSLSGYHIDGDGVVAIV